MNPQIATVLTTFLYVLIVLIVVRSLLSWFPGIDRRSPWVQMLDNVVEPLLDPVRRIMPRTGMIDLSGFAVIIVLYLMIAVVNNVADKG